MPAANDHLQSGCREALRHLLRNELHGSIEPWMQQANDQQKRAVVRLARLSDPSLLQPVGKKRAEKWERLGMAKPERAPEGATNGLHFNAMSRSYSSPQFSRFVEDPALQAMRQGPGKSNLAM
eukprot:gnl/TRDRNA2_/TRDRNA2_178442_c0_seq1.p1 gnl/TRDRNA2_/TRDRNA2_178442_c0~~gnl/TRDRNA2_/TRDRNA2_178442_c0_seq1.p1  ORF type:complete len:123 (-),score=22.23 gnl/TRDRNA2_/TRDRNA2_178442_c0_seq1:163-531(-)